MNYVVVIGIVITVLTLIPVIRQIKGHPRGLLVLFFAEMWERFSYYGMRALLIFYLTQHFLFSDSEAQGLYGAYTSLVYLTPMIGGILADRYLGTRKAVAFGALLLVAGHMLMAYEGEPAQQVLAVNGAEYPLVVEGRGSLRQVMIEIEGEPRFFHADKSGALVIDGYEGSAALPSRLEEGAYDLKLSSRDSMATNSLYLALSLIILGVCYLKPNISSIVGQLYKKNDPRRDPGFTLYYYGINLGAFWASILCGLLGQTVGWWAGFGLAGVGMALGWVVFILGKPLLEGRGEPPNPQLLQAKVGGVISREALIYTLSIAGLGFIWLLVQRHEVVGYLLGACSLLVLAYLGTLMKTTLSRVESHRIILALILISAAVMFWTLFEQAGSSLNQFANRNTELSLFGVSIEASQTQSFNSGFILLLAPIFSALWAYMGSRGSDLSAPLKFSLALMQVGLGFLVLVWGASYAGVDHKVPLIFLMLAYLLHTTGELFISPVGLSQMTKLATATLISTLMAVWFLSSAWAQWLGALVAKLTASKTVAGQVLDPAHSLARYVEVFYEIGLYAIGLGVLLMLFSKLLNKLAHGVK
ncbi:MAG: peptide ABC transporter [Rhodomicrobium sp.]|nr:MAG: peptide ABC transporter [Rhodomicrobium sp.]